MVLFKTCSLCRPLKHVRFSSSNKRERNYDVVVVGGGIVGVASARECLLRYPKLKMAIAEKENTLALHQTGHNSGVIHAGIYYKPGTLKAKLCVEGLELMYKYCDEKKIPYKKVGKLIVATDENELANLDDLYARAKKNNVKDLKVIEADKIQYYEPNCRGVKALLSPHTGIVDFAVVCKSFGADFEKAGGTIFYNFEVNGFKETSDADYPVLIQSKGGEQLQAKFVLTCAGLYSDTMAELTGCHKYPRIVPIRGEYLLLKESKQNLVKGNIYPVPNPKLPFLGVHFTPRMDGSIWMGPNAVLAFKREGYNWFDVNVSELWDAIKYPGFIKLAMKNTKFGIVEIVKSVFISKQVKDLQRFMPVLTAADICRGPAGVRAQALDISGSFVDDFLFDMGKTQLGRRVLHCRNAPSPGATSSLGIAKMMTTRLEEEFKLSQIK